MTTESLMIHALKRGLLLVDFNALSVGMILGYINQYDDMLAKGNAKVVNFANQQDFNTF